MKSGLSIVVSLWAMLGVGVAMAFNGLLLLEMANASVRPPQPLPLGTLQRVYETDFTVDRVRRLPQIRIGSTVYTAHGEFYLVDARVLCPLGERYRWDDRHALVRSYAGSGSSAGHSSIAYHVDETVQQALDNQTGRPGPVHEVLGASQRELLIFDLPRSIEQPGLIFTDANNPLNAFDVVFGNFWEPRRFNLRYD